MSNSITKGFVALLFTEGVCHHIGIVVSKDLSLFFRVCQSKGLSPFRLCHLLRVCRLLDLSPFRVCRLLCIWCNYRAYRLSQVVPIKGFVEVPCMVPHALLYGICRIQSRICCLKSQPSAAIIIPTSHHHHLFLKCNIIKHVSWSGLAACVESTCCCQGLGMV